MVDQKRLFAVLANQVSGKVDGEHRGSYAALGAEEGNDAPDAALRVGIDRHDCVETLERGGEFSRIDRLGQELRASPANGTQQKSCVQLSADTDDADLLEKYLMQTLRCLQRQFHVAVEVDEGDAGSSVFQQRRELRALV